MFKDSPELVAALNKDISEGLGADWAFTFSEFLYHGCDTECCRCGLSHLTEFGPDWSIFIQFARADESNTIWFSVGVADVQSEAQPPPPDILLLALGRLKDWARRVIIESRKCGLVMVAR